MKILMMMLTSLSIPSLAFGLAAFPGAEGFGANATSGARGYSGSKTVCVVRNTDDSGPGSIRSCVEGAGHEGTYVVFSASGTIHLKSNLIVRSDYLTIAGQTSPDQNTDFDGDGYSDLEAYLHELGGYGTNSSTPEDPQPTPAHNDGSSGGGCFIGAYYRIDDPQAKAYCRTRKVSW